MVLNSVWSPVASQDWGVGPNGQWEGIWPGKFRKVVEELEMTGVEVPLLWK